MTSFEKLKNLTQRQFFDLVKAYKADNKKVLNSYSKKIRQEFDSYIKLIDKTVPHDNKKIDSMNSIFINAI